MTDRSGQRRAGDPAFQGSDAITHEPVVEEQRPSPSVGPRRAMTKILLGALVVLVALAVLAGATAGWAYTIPFAIVAALMVMFVAVHSRPRDDQDSTVPNVGFEEGPDAKPSGEPVHDQVKSPPG
jgi:hypothetical protein